VHYDILGVAITRAKADANIASIVGTKIYNNVPKNTSPPYLRVQWSEAQDMEDKTANSQFISGTLSFDFWTENFGDKDVLDMMNHLTDEFHLSPLTLTQGSTNLLITREGYNTFLEGDGLSRHGVITFNLLIED
jgi:hypothetical protein